jgi:adenosylhomocysteine nucleosidase
MGIDTGRAVPGVAVIAALSVERSSLALAVTDSTVVSVHQSGPGHTRAGATARTAAQAGARALVSWGLAGGLTAAVATGDVVVAERIVSERGVWLSDSRWLGALRVALGDFALHTGAVASVDAVLESPDSKARVGRATGAIAVDMESAAIAAVAADFGIPFASVRVIADGCADALPDNVAQWIDAKGRQRIAPMFGIALTPAQWPRLVTLAQRYRIAARTLREAARVLGARNFCNPNPVPLERERRA